MNWQGFTFGNSAQYVMQQWPNVSVIYLQMDKAVCMKTVANLVSA